MGERRRFFALILTMAAVATAVTGVVLVLLYHAAFEEERARLTDTAQSQARLIEAIARHEKRQAAPTAGHAAPWTSRIVGQIREAHANFAGFGKTGEFTLARREGDNIVFLLRHRHSDLAHPRPVPFSSAFAEPMRRALAGKSGTIVGLDYRGATVLAAYEPVAVLDLGIVAKIDLAEVRAPFVRAGILAGGIALALVLAGALVLRRVGEPLLRHIEESERKYRKIFESANDGICVMSNVFEDCNEQICRIWACEREDVIGHALLDFSPPTQPDGRKSSEAAREYMRTALTGEPRSFYWQHRRKDGVLIDTEISLKTIEVGRRNLFLAVVRDITERTRAEAEIRARVRQQTAVAELGRSAMTGTELQALFQKAAELVSECLGVEYAKVLELLPDGKRLLLRAGVGWKSGLVGTATVGTDTGSQAGYTLLANEPVVVEDLSRETRFSGPPLLTEHGVVSGLSTVIRGLPSPFGVFGAHTTRHREFSESDVNFLRSVANLLADVISRHKLAKERARLLDELTAKNAQLELSNRELAAARTAALNMMANAQEAEAQARAAQERFRLVIESSPNAVVVVNPKGRITLVNASAETTFGYARKDLVGQSVGMLIPERFRDKHETACRQFFAASRIGFMEGNHAAHGRRADGDEFPIEIGLSRFESGEGPRVLAVVQDTTERRRAEEERENLIAELRAKNAELEQFNYTVSHELKTPLITIRGFLDILRHDLAGGDVARLDSDIQHIRRASDTMRDLLDDLLKLSRLGWLAASREPVPLGETAHDVLEGLADRIAERAVRVTVAPDLPVVLGDRTRLRAVLQNLIENAVKFSGDQAAPRIHVGWRREKEETVFFVSDNGIGIDPRFHDKVFGLFEHLDPNTEGTGVGLALIRRIIEAHGGRIWVESEGVGKGSIFCFTVGAMEV